jgi:GT2 family glycosyltransferase
VSCRDGAEPRSAAVSFCVVNYNGEAFLQETLESILGEMASGDELLLADNASTDGSVALAQRLWPAVRVVGLDANRGPGAARNAAYRRASHARLLFVDNDVSLVAGCTARLVAALDRDRDAVAAMPLVLDAARDGVVQYDGADAHYLGLMLLHDEGLAAAAAPRATKRLGSLVSACFLLDRSRWTGGDPFDESIFIYFDDHDFALQARLRGHALLGVPSAAVRHREGTAELSLRRLGRYAPARVLNTIRNRWLIVLKHYSARTLLLLSPMLVVYELAQLVVVLEKGWVGAWGRSVGWILVRGPRILRERRRLQRARVLPDRELLVGGPLPFTAALAAGRVERAGRRILDAAAAGWWAVVRRFL